MCTVLSALILSITWLVDMSRLIYYKVLEVSIKQIFKSLLLFNILYLKCRII